MIGKGDKIVCRSRIDKDGYINELIKVGDFYVILDIAYDIKNNPEYFWIRVDGHLLKYPVYLFNTLKFIRNKVIGEILE